MLQYIDTILLQYLLQQYNTIQLKGNINILHIAIYCGILQYTYCNVCYLNVVNAQSLHQKNDWIFRNLDYTIEFCMLLYSYTGCIYFLYCQNPYSHMKCLFTKIQSNIAIRQYIPIHSNTISNIALIRIVSALAA